MEGHFLASMLQLSFPAKEKFKKKNCAASSCRELAHPNILCRIFLLERISKVIQFPALYRRNLATSAFLAGKFTASA